MKTSTTKYAEEFIEQLCTLKDYWLNESRAETSEEKIDGFIHSLLTMIDGDSGINDFHYIKLLDTVMHKYINNGNVFLHEMYFNIDRRMKQVLR